MFTCLYAYRDEVESDLEFLGILILQNKLKKETEPVIQTLRKAGISTKMVTGLYFMVNSKHVKYKCDIFCTLGFSDGS